MSSWRAFEEALDEFVDGVWGEPVEFYHMLTGGLEDNPAPDPSRPPLKTVGVFMMPGAAATGEAGMPGSAGFAVTQIKMWISITEYNIGDLSEWDNKDDRVYLPERDQWFSIQSILPSATGRPNIYIDRLNKDNP